MALRVREIASLGGAQASIVATYEDGAEGAARALINVTVTNSSPWPLRVTVTHEVTQRSRSVLIEAGLQRSIDIPNTNPQRLAVELASLDRFSGLSWQLAWGVGVA